MEKVPIWRKLIWQSLSTSRLLEKICCNHVWKLNTGLEGLLLLGMEIALPHAISQAKPLLSTCTSFCLLHHKKNSHWNYIDGEMNTFSVSDSDTQCQGLWNSTYKHHKYKLSSIFHYCFIIIISHSSLTLKTNLQLMDIKLGLLPCTASSVFKYNIKSINAVKNRAR